jgi:hypothetical protein
LARPPKVKYADLQETLAESPVIDNNPLEFDLRVDFFRQSENSVVTTITLQAQNSELQFSDNGGLQQARMNIFGRITAVTDKRAGIFEESVIATSTVEDLSDTRDRKSVYQTQRALAPGHYKVQVVVRDVGTGNKGVRSLGFTVPNYNSDKLMTSTLILASKLRTTTDNDIGGRFVIGNAKVIPNLTAKYKRGEEVGIYLQVYNTKINETTLRPDVDVEYILEKNGKPVLIQKEDWSGLSDSGQRLTLARLLPTSTMDLGKYTIKIRIKDRVGSEVRMLEPSAVFTISE